MSSLFSHIFIPLAILFIFSRKLKIDPKKIIILSFFGAFPDADIILFHRASFHNIFILIIPILAFILVKREEILIISFYIASHIILDMFNGGIYLLYPFYDNVFFSHVETWISEYNFGYILDYGINDRIVNIKGKESLVSSENFGTVILLAIPILILIITKWYKHEKEL